MDSFIIEPRKALVIILHNEKSGFFQQELRTLETKDTKGVYFVVADDLRGGACLKNETNRRTVFPILRHLQLTREIRGPGSVVRFAVV